MLNARSSDTRGDSYRNASPLRFIEFMRDELNDRLIDLLCSYSFCVTIHRIDSHRFLILREVETGKSLVPNLHH